MSRRYESRSYTTTAEVCPTCLGSVAASNPDCLTCCEGADDYRATELTAVGMVTPGDPGCTWGPPERCYPADPAEIDSLRITRSDTGAEVDVDDLPEAMREGLADALLSLCEADDSGPDDDDDFADEVTP